MPYLSLPSTHYAAAWGADREIRNTEEVTDIGVEYAHETDPLRKQELLLKLVRFFHPYTFKYVSMIVTGSVPKHGNSINPDVKLFLKFFLQPDVKSNPPTLSKVARKLGLAFKGMTHDEIYDVLVGCLMRAFGKYDPEYSLKVKNVIAAVDKLRAKSPTFTAKQISEIVGFQATRICKMLCTKGYLTRESVEGQPKLRLLAVGVWPPGDKLFIKDRIDLQYFASYYFRHYLQQFITQEMKQLEARKNIMQPDHRTTGTEYLTRTSSSDDLQGSVRTIKVYVCRRRN